MAKFLFKENVTDNAPFTARLGAGTGAGNNWSNVLESGKFVKQVGDSRYDLAVAGDKIDAHVLSIESATADGYTIGTLADEGRMTVTLDGLEATPGTGAIAIGDYVVVGTCVAKGTALSGPAKVTKATNQPGTSVVSGLAGADTAAAVKTVLDAALVKVADAQKNVLFAWRLVSATGTAVGSIGLIECVAG